MRQTAHAKSKKFIKLQDFKDRSKLLILGFGMLVVLLITGLCVYARSNSDEKFSKSDFDRLTADAREVLKNTGASIIHSNNSCSRESAGEFGQIKLYCRIQLVSYVKVSKEAKSNELLNKYYTEIRNHFGRVMGSSTGYEKQPMNGYADFTISLKSPLPVDQCNFQIGSGRYSQGIAPFFDQSDRGTTGLYFECIAESQGEYFPVTYRQG